jgi:hypothetical protein
MRQVEVLTKRSAKHGFIALHLKLFPRWQDPDFQDLS